MDVNKMRQQIVKLHLGMAQTTITELAESIGYSRSAVSNVLAGRKRSPTIEAAVAERTGFRVEDLWPATGSGKKGDMKR
ncbi:helix-turn-helix transcriptional regulator [Celeribacter baekdonensis]|uniref:helix-turn-helix transcriptional regulator n=1 Tax=Celeribacter baekdonensis TaxID=875171 RepID=UPI0030DCE27C|tara:strand:- start:28174 stop:28410 length:237 start_codon:yes stop_codon:yes gene_type:complete